MSIVFWLAEAKTSAGAFWVIWVASVLLAPKLKVTFAPGCAASKSFPIRVNASLSDDAAKTVMGPAAASDGLDADGDVAPVDAREPQAREGQGASTATTAR